MSDFSNEMPRYQCHKKVRALKLRNIPWPTKDGAILEFEGVGYAPITVPTELFARYRPTAGDYYIVYDDGYASFSPAKAFEDGYTRI